VGKTCKTSEYLASRPSLELSTFDYNWNNTVSTKWFACLLLLFFVVVVVIAVVGGGVVMMAASFVVVVVLAFAAVVLIMVTDCVVCS